MSNIEIVIWGWPPGVTEHTDPTGEQLLATQCVTASDVRRIISAAKADGWHSLRVTTVNLDTPPDFTNIFNTRKMK